MATKEIPNRILYEDNHLIIVNKLPSEITQGDKTGDEPMGEDIKRYLKEKYHKPGNVFLGVVHRLDRPVSGAVIFARTSKALARMNEMQKRREIRKVYWAVCGRQMAVGGQQSAVSSQPSVRFPAGELQTVNCEREWRNLVNYLVKNEQQNKSYVYPNPGTGRLKAELKYRIAAESDRYILLEVELLTGRHHQIRAQLSSAGFVIKGDLKYGAPRSNADGSIHLHSRLVEFTHPVSKEQVRVLAPCPDETLWKVFENILS